jgi:hypothetical protein
MRQHYAYEQALVFIEFSLLVLDDVVYRTEKRVRYLLRNMEELTMQPDDELVVMCDRGAMHEDTKCSLINACCALGGEMLQLLHHMLWAWERYTRGCAACRHKKEV